jgi:hypothetical protein
MGSLMELGRGNLGRGTEGLDDRPTRFGRRSRGRGESGAGARDVYWRCLQALSTYWRWLCVRGKLQLTDAGRKGAIGARCSRR